MPTIYEVLSEYLHVHCHVHQLGVAIILMPLEQFFPFEQEQAIFLRPAILESSCGHFGAQVNYLRIRNSFFPQSIKQLK
jgi:hypothetical protein